MPFLTVASITVPVAPDGAEEVTEEIGDRARAFDGTMRFTLQARKRVWMITTVPMTPTAAATLRAALVGTPPVSCAGDFLGGTVNCIPEILPRRGVKVGAGARYALSFALHEQ